MFSCYVSGPGEHLSKPPVGTGGDSGLMTASDGGPYVNGRTEL